MATLTGKVWLAENDRRVAGEFTIDPVAPASDGPRDAYRLRIGPNSDQFTIDTTLILHGYHGAHDEMKFVAEMCREARALLTLPRRSVGASRWSVVAATGWADIHLIEAATKGAPGGIDLAVYVRDLVRNGPNPVWRHGRCTLFSMKTTVDEIAHFGDTLIGELIAAWEKRQALGMSVGAEAQDWPAYFADDPKWSEHFS